MILNGITLQDYTTEENAKKIMTRVKTYGIGFDKMALDSIKNLRPMVHFRSEDFIKIIENKLKTIKHNHKPINEKLLKIVKGIE